MGRLSDARKKAKAKQPGAGSDGGAGVHAAGAAPTPAVPPAAEAAAPELEAETIDAAEPAPAPKPRSGKTLPASGLADEILVAEKPAISKARKLPSSGLAEDILGAAPETPAPRGAAAPSGLADEILGAAAESDSLADAILNGFADEPPSQGGLAGEVLAAMTGAPLQAPNEASLDQGFEAGVLDVLLDTPRAAPRSLPSSGLAEDILPAKQGRATLALDEIHEFESFFEEERHEIEQLHLVLFRVATEQFAVEIDRVHEVIRVPAITRVPHLAAHIRGVVNLRGRIVPVMDLRLLMNLPPRAVDRMSRIMVLDLAKKQIGVLVDLVSEVLHVSVADVEPPPDEMRAIDRNLVTAVARAEKRMIFILDMDKVLALK